MGLAMQSVLLLAMVYSAICSPLIITPRGPRESSSMTVIKKIVEETENTQPSVSEAKENGLAATSITSELKKSITSSAKDDLDTDKSPVSESDSSNEKLIQGVQPVKDTMLSIAEPERNTADSSTPSEIDVESEKTISVLNEQGSDKVNVKDTIKSKDMEADAPSEDIFKSKEEKKEAPEQISKEGKNEEEKPEAVSNTQVKVEDETEIPEIKKIFYINMDKDVKRRDSVTEQLRKYAADIQHVRVTGVHIDDLPFNPQYKDKSLSQECCDESKSCHATFENLMNKRSCCCDFSHREAFRQVSQQEDGLYLVIEDDVEFEENWQDQLREAWRTLPSDWDVVRLGYWGDMHADDRISGGHWLNANRNRDKWPRFKGYYGAHAIVLTPGKAKKLLETIKDTKLDFADRFTMTATVNGKLIKNYVLEKCAVCVAVNEQNQPTGTSSRWDTEESTSFSLFAGGSSIVKDDVTGKVLLGGSAINGLHIHERYTSSQNVLYGKISDNALTSSST